MEEKSIGQISKRARDLYNRATKAAKQNQYKYAADMLRDCLKFEPGFVEGRKTLRQVQTAMVGGKKTGGLKQMIAQLSTMGSTMKGSKMLKSGNVAEALDLAESAMNVDPSVTGTLKFLITCLRKAELGNAEYDALKLVEKFYPADINNLKALAECCKRIKDADGIIAAHKKIVDMRPNDQQAQADFKSATAFVAMMKGKWDEEGSYQSKLKDKDKAKELEQKEKAVARDEETLQDLIDAAEAKCAESDSQAIRKRLAELYTQQKNWAKALVNYDKFVEFAGTIEPNIANAMVEIKVSQFDEQIATAAGEAAKAEIEKAKEEMLFTHNEDMVQRFPNDPNFHFSFGELLYGRGDYTRAIGEMQAAQRNPQYKGKAGRVMGLCFHAKGQFDMAVDQFRTILKDMLTMNEEKKETLYSLGLSLESQGKDEEAIDVFKEIYQGDVSYKDIGEKIDAFYQKKQQNA